jgi:hypothetical protein
MRGARFEASEVLINCLDPSDIVVRVRYDMHVECLVAGIRASKQFNIG